MKNLTIYLSNGHVLKDIMVEDFDMTISGGEVDYLRWKHVPGASEKLIFVAPKDIVAVTQKETL